MPHIRISTNQTTWTTATFAGGTVTGNFISFVNTNNVWGALTSTGQVWRNSQNTASLGSFSLSPSYPTGLTQLSHFNGVFVGIAGGNVQFSNDLIDWYGGLQWTTVVTPMSGYQIGRVVYGNGIWIAVPTQNSTGYAPYNRGTQFLGLSTNGTTWTTVQSPATNLNTPSSGFAYGNGRWVYGSSFLPPQWMTSTDGTTWTSITPPGGENCQCFSIAYGNGRWMSAGGSPFTATSTDGITWVTDNNPTMNNTSHLVKHVNNLWFVSNRSWTKTSTNGTTWTTIFNTPDFWTIPFDFDYGHGRWVGVGRIGLITTSTNGTTWTTIASPAGAGYDFGNVVYGNGIWIASGSSARSPSMREAYMSRVHITSTNGTTWTTVTSIGRSNLSYNNGVWVASYNKFFVSTNPTGQSNCNKFIKSEDEQRGAFLSNSGVLFNWNGQEAFDTISTGINDNFVNGAIRNNGGQYEYIIQGNNAMYRSTNLTTWTTISNPPASSVNDIIGKT